MTSFESEPKAIRPPSPIKDASWMLARGVLKEAWLVKLLSCDERLFAM